MLIKLDPFGISTRFPYHTIASILHLYLILLNQIPLSTPVSLLDAVDYA